MDLGLHNKIALVTAATKGLGFAAAKELVQERAKVVVCGREQARLEQALSQLRSFASDPNHVVGTMADVTNPAGADQLIAFTVAAFGGLDILITNAGGPAGGTFATTSLENWEKGLNLTLLSAVRLIQAALPHLRQSQAASILTITSISVKQPITGLFLSNAIRPAVVGLTKSLAQELAPAGIRANSILPGWTQTERVDEILEYRAKVNHSTPEQEMAKITASVPLGRMARPEEFGKVAAFLVSPAASYLTGVMLQVDGGSYSGLL